MCAEDFGAFLWNKEQPESDIKATTSKSGRRGLGMAWERSGAWGGDKCSVISDQYSVRNADIGYRRSEIGNSGCRMARRFPNSDLRSPISDIRPLPRSPLHPFLLPATFSLPKRGRTGFDCWFETQAACRGSLVGLVKTPGQNITANNVVEADFSSEELALAA